MATDQEGVMKTVEIPVEYKEMWEQARRDPIRFWENAAITAMIDVHWFKPWRTTFEWEYPSFRWYVGGSTNMCFNCLDYKVLKGYGDKTAFIEISGERDETRSLSYNELLDLVKTYAAALRGMGVEKGDRVMIYMPMSIDACAVTLACARIGAIHVAVFAGFSSQAIADRLELTTPRVAFVQDVGSRRGKAVPLKEMFDRGLQMSGVHLETVVVSKRGEEPSRMNEQRDITWEEFVKKGEGQSHDYVEMESNELLFIMPTSGTTRKPKPTVQAHGGYQVYIYSMAHWIYGRKPEDVWFSTSDIGWIVGHSYNTYEPLLSGCTSILYEGTPDYPRPDMWWDIVEKHKVTALWLSPTGARGLMMFGLEQAEKHDLSSVERIFCAGEVLNPPVWRWLQKEVFKDRIPVVDHMWQTESSGPMFANPYGLEMAPIKPGSSALPVPGIVPDIVDELTGRSLLPGEKGTVVIRRPWPGLTPTLYGDPESYRAEYWEKTPGTSGSYYCGDAANFDKDGYIWFSGRSDEVIKIAAHRIGTIEVENVLISHPAVGEAAVSGVPDELRGEVCSAFVVLNSGYTPSTELKNELIRHVRDLMGPIVVFRDIEFVRILPKTRSGKIMRRVLKKLWLLQDLGDLSTLEDEASVEELRDAIKKMGIE